jgi:hypothetical protein
MTDKIVTAEDLLARMRAGTKEVHEIRMRDQIFPVRVLALDEVTSVRREALAQSAKLRGDDTDKNVWTQKLTLKLASTIGKDGVPLLGDKLLSMLSLDEVQYLYSEYIRVADAVNPSLELISPERFRAIVDALKKNLLTSKDCSLLELRAICSAFAELIQRMENQNSPTDK